MKIQDHDRHRARAFETVRQGEGASREAQRNQRTDFRCLLRRGADVQLHGVVVLQLVQACDRCSQQIFVKIITKFGTFSAVSASIEQLESGAVPVGGELVGRGGLGALHGLPVLSSATELGRRRHLRHLQTHLPEFSMLGKRWPMLAIFFQRNTLHFQKNRKLFCRNFIAILSTQPCKST